MSSRISRDDRLRVTYRLKRRELREAKALAREIAYEQTVELPPGCVDAELTERIVGRVEEATSVGIGRFRATVSYDARTLGGEIPQLFNLLFGNVSMYSGVLLTEVEWPLGLLEELGGPRHGVDGLREACGVSERRPLLCAALKPMGLSPERLAGLCYELASGGIDIVKDDHGLGDQADAPFEPRVARCQEAVQRANADHGTSAVYFPHLTGPHFELASRLAHVRASGCAGVLVSPLLVGPDLVRAAGGEGVVVMSHPTLAGAFLQPDHGFVPGVLLGDLFRVIGSDSVIYPNAGGRFPFTRETCREINEALRAPLGPLRPAFPTPGGGIDVRRVPYWLDAYGPDTILLIGGSLYASGDLRRAGAELRDLVARGG